MDTSCYTGAEENTMATIEQRVTSLETEFRTELRHLATKADLVELKSELRGDLLKLAIGLATLQVVGLGTTAAIVKLLG